jgi:hypothetical protein
METAVNRARLLIGCYRTENFADADIAIRALVAILMRYPEEVVIAITEPATGIPAKLKWPPSLAEVVSACDAELAPMLRQLRRDQLAFDQKARIVSSMVEARPNLEELQAAMGEHFGLTPPPDDPAIRDPTVTDRRLESERRKMLAEYAHLNQDPVYAAPGMLVSPSLVRLMKDQPRPQRRESG